VCATILGRTRAQVWQGLQLRDNCFTALPAKQAEFVGKDCRLVQDGMSQDRGLPLFVQLAAEFDFVSDQPVYY
jgi:hypothetical protein